MDKKLMKKNNVEVQGVLNDICGEKCKHKEYGHAGGDYGFCNMFLTEIYYYGDEGDDLERCDECIEFFKEVELWN